MQHKNVQPAVAADLAAEEQLYACGRVAFLVGQPTSFATAQKPASVHLHNTTRNSGEREGT